ncbi:transcription factor HHO5-like isoform X2 [Carya illinoinensis]|uniref:HTH myb-type domain-containing protein n=1 Tax=Carya illinoinensis TaxID=32201 RepID=A0A8T1RJ19_CARIL|nr:transcription factor HHO5-like isoform X2 [Carya illinoinensis]KAG6666323.1 hypothetical protein CIPAW_01G023300 [Carya illinoinensis]
MELTLDLTRVFVPITVSELVTEISTAGNNSEKLLKLHDCMQRLKDERSKIEGFKRELPLCMHLLNDAIGRLKEAAMHCMESDSDDKKNWMNSAKLWITGPDHDYKKEESASEAKLHGEEDDRSVLENPIQPQSNRNMGGNFPSLKEENEVSQVTSLSLMTPLPELNPSDSVSKRRTSFGCRGSNSGSSLLTEPPRKQRRYWSPQLHRCFFEAVQQLGGEQVATPKQIRELMQVDGLTNDEVKSHLQKYRLHVQRHSFSSSANGLWMAQDQHRKRSNPKTSQSGSAKGNLLADGSAKGLFSIGDDSKVAEADEESDGHSCKGGLQEP